MWDGLDNNRGYARLATLVEDLFGADAADAIRVPFHMGDPETLLGLATTAVAEPTCASSRRRAIRNRRSMGPHRDPWLDARRQHRRPGVAMLLDAAQEQLADLVTDGEVAFDVSALVVSGTTA